MDSINNNPLPPQLPSNPDGTLHISSSAAINNTVPSSSPYEDSQSLLLTPGSVIWRSWNSTACAVEVWLRQSADSVVHRPVKLGSGSTGGKYVEDDVEGTGNGGDVKGSEDDVEGSGDERSEEVEEVEKSDKWKDDSPLIPVPKGRVCVCCCWFLCYCVRVFCALSFSSQSSVSGSCGNSQVQGSL